ncbi:MAG: mechanosensitive ion channel family protein [Phycisphaerales bacterium]
MLAVYGQFMDWKLLHDWNLLDSEDRLLGRAASEWIAAGVVFLCISIGVTIVQGFLSKRFRPPDGDDRSWRALVFGLATRWMKFTTLVIALVCAALMLRPDERVATIAKGVLVVILAIQAVRLIPVVVDWALHRLAGTKKDEDLARSARGTIISLRWVILLVLYTLLFLLALQNLGINVTAMIAGLGIGGIAVALAAQNILGDLFSSLSIALDKPFVVGDFIVVGNELGTVEHIGLKTTRVRSLSGEQLVFGNADLLSSRIRNYKRMNERRVVFAFGVTYSTAPDVLQQIPDMVKAFVLAQDACRFDRCHFHRFGASSLDFEVVYYINSPDYNTHMNALQAIHLSIAREFNQRGIEFAFPTQTLYISRPSPEPAPAHPASRNN